VMRHAAIEFHEPALESPDRLGMMRTHRFDHHGVRPLTECTKPKPAIALKSCSTSRDISGNLARYETASRARRLYDAHQLTRGAHHVEMSREPCARTLPHFRLRAFVQRQPPV